MKVHTKLMKSNTLMGIKATTSSPTTTYQPTTHLPRGILKTCLIEVECSKVQDQLRIIITMLNLVSKVRIKEFREHKIKNIEELNPLKIK